MPGDDDLAAIVARCAAGALPANVALMQMILAADAHASIDAALAGGPAALRALWRDHAGAFGRLREVARCADAPASGDIAAHWAAVFDAAAQLSPQAGAALYALDDAALLARATAEIVAYLEAEALLGPDSVVLDFGCGAGRVAAALAPRVRRVHAVDVSAAMALRAREACAGSSHVTVDHVSGRALVPCGDGAYDLVLAVDSFPYLIAADGALARDMLREFARVLAPRGVGVIMNFSYRGDPAQDLADCRAWGVEAGFSPCPDPLQPFTLWDAMVYRVERKW